MKTVVSEIMNLGRERKWKSTHEGMYRGTEMVSKNRYSESEKNMEWERNTREIGENNEK